MPYPPPPISNPALNGTYCIGLSEKETKSIREDSMKKECFLSGISAGEFERKYPFFQGVFRMVFFTQNENN